MSSLSRLGIAVIGLVLASVADTGAIQLVSPDATGNVGQARGMAPMPKQESPSVPKPGADIWIPGLGVVGKMPSFDFGLEMLYRQSGEDSGAMPDRSDFDALDPDFAIKGTIKKKF